MSRNMRDAFFGPFYRADCFHSAVPAPLFARHPFHADYNKRIAFVNNIRAGFALGHRGQQTKKKPLFFRGFCTSLDYLGFKNGGAAGIKEFVQ
jgi:hypothetical protein